MSMRTIRTEELKVVSILFFSLDSPLFIRLHGLFMRLQERAYVMLASMGEESE